MMTPVENGSNLFGFAAQQSGGLPNSGASRVHSRLTGSRIGVTGVDHQSANTFAGCKMLTRYDDRCSAETFCVKTPATVDCGANCTTNKSYVRLLYISFCRSQQDTFTGSSEEELVQTN